MRPGAGDRIVVVVLLAAAAGVALAAGPAVAGEAETPPPSDSATGDETEAPPDSATRAGVGTADGTEATPSPAPTPAPPAPAIMRAPAPAPAGSGVDAVLRRPDLERGGPPTLLERYGAGGYTLDTDLTLHEATERAVNAIAGALFSLTVWIASAVIALLQWAFAADLTAPLRGPVTALVGVLHRSVYTPLVGAAVVLAGGYGLWHGLVRRRGTLAAQGLTWSVVAVTAGLVFLARPGDVVDGANRATVELSRTVLAGVAAVDPQAREAGGGADAELRMASDRLWRLFVHQPWLLAEFGDPALGQQLGEELLAAKTLTPGESRRARTDPGAAADLSADKAERYAALRDRLREGHPDAYAWFSGRRATERVGVAGFALLALLAVGGLLILLAGAVVVVQLAFLLLVVAAPVFLLVGIHPGAGRILALRWGELLVAVVIKRVLYAALLAVLLVLGGALLDATAGLGWGVAALLQILLIATVVVYRRPFARVLSTVAGSAAPAAQPSGSDRGGPVRVPRSARDRRSPARPSGPQASSPSASRGVAPAVAAAARRARRSRAGPDRVEEGVGGPPDRETGGSAVDTGAEPRGEPAPGVAGDGDPNGDGHSRLDAGGLARLLRGPGVDPPDGPIPPGGREEG